MTLTSRFILWFISLMVCLICGLNVVSTEESGGKDFLGSLNENSAELASKLVRAQWVYETNNTENAKNDLVKLTSEAIKSIRVRFQKVLNLYPWQSFSNPDVRRQLKFFSEIGTLALPDEEYNQFEKTISDLDVIQQNTTICDYYNTTKCDLHYSDMKEKLETSQNSGELAYLWTEWRKATASKLKKLLESYVKLCNQAAVLNNYPSFKEYSLRNIESNDIKHEMITLWEDIKPLYSQIHAYVRRKLRDIYGENIVSRKGPIPAYLLGNIWSEKWSSRRIIPYPKEDNVNFTSAMISQAFTPERVRKVAEDFFVSMNFSIPPSIWANTSEKLSNANGESCHPKIFNFYANGVRIKNCEKVSLKDYLEDIRLLTKAEYVLQYRNQPYIYQTPADPGLEEAMSNVMTMSASTFSNLKRLGLYKGEITEEVRLNRLFKLALEKLTSLTFLLVQELWRWDVYSGKDLDETANTMNDLRERFQGISTFTKELTFDPGGIGSAFSKLSLSHHFLGSFLEFQLYESLCKMSKTSQQEIDLTECNLYGNVEAGEALRKMMSLGFSRPLTETFSSVLGISKINSKSILKYFHPLMKWLEKENEMAGESIGWECENPKDGSNPTKTRRKRSPDNYPSELKGEDSDMTPSREPDRFQRLVYKRSKNNQDNTETNLRERESAGYFRDKSAVSNDGLALEERPGIKAEERVEESFSTKNRRSSLAKHKNNNKHSRQITSEENEMSQNAEQLQKANPRNVKRNLGFETVEQTFIDAGKLESSAGDIAERKRSFEFGGNSNEDFKSNLASKGGNYESMADYDRVKSTDDRDEDTEDKESNKLWSMKSYLTENVMLPESSPEKKENLIGSRSLTVRAAEEKSIRKKEASHNEQSKAKEMVKESSDRRLLQSGDTRLKRLNIDIPSLQAILQRADMNAYQPSQVFSLTPDLSDNRDKNEISSLFSSPKLNSNNKFSNYLFKYTSPSDTLQYKERKEFREGEAENKGKSPYIIILGQSPPETREKLQGKGVNFREADENSPVKNSPDRDEKKISDKRNRATNQIYLIPIDLKSSQPNLIKTDHYAEYEHEAGQDPNTEREQGSEEQLQLEDDSKLDENGNFYKPEKDSPSKFIISWNKEKNRKIVKRRKRDHQKGVDDDKMDVVRIAPMKNSFLEGLLGNSLDQANIADKNVKIFIQNGPLNENSESSQMSSSSSKDSSVSPSGSDQTDPQQDPPAPLTSLASSVLTSISPKGLSQLVKATNQHQDMDLEEENLKENGNVQSFGGKKKAAKLHSDEEKSLIDVEQAAKGDDLCCKKIILTPCQPRCPPPCPCPCPPPCPCPCPPSCPCPPPPPCPEDCCRKIECSQNCCKQESSDLCCKKPSECSLVNCQFKITKSKKPHERLTIMIYDRINPPAELPEPYDALAVISEILQRIQCCSCKPSCQLTEEDPDYPANDNSDQLKGNPTPSQDNSKVQEISGEIPILGNESSEDGDSEESTQMQRMQNSPSSVEEDKYQPKGKATPALDQLTVFNKDKLKPVFFELRKLPGFAIVKWKTITGGTARRRLFRIEKNRQKHSMMVTMVPKNVDFAPWLLPFTSAFSSTNGRFKKFVSYSITSSTYF